MPPAPARIAARPSPSSRECWNPAVPPPPVAGGTVGTGLGVGLADGLAVGLGDVVGLGDEVGDGVVGGLTLELAVGVGEPDAPGEIGGGVAEGVDPEQAESPAEPIRAKAAQPATVNFALRPVPLMVVRILRRGTGWGAAALTCDGLFITGIKATRSKRPREEAGPAPALAGPERPSATVSRHTTQRYRLGEEQGEK